MARHTSSVPLLELRRGMSHCWTPDKVLALSNVFLQSRLIFEGTVRCETCEHPQQARRGICFQLSSFRWGGTCSCPERSAGARLQQVKHCRASRCQ